MSQLPCTSKPSSKVGQVLTVSRETLAGLAHGVSFIFFLRKTRASLFFSWFDIFIKAYPRTLFLSFIFFGLVGCTVSLCSRFLAFLRNLCPVIGFEWPKLVYYCRARGLPLWLSWCRSCLQCRRPEFLLGLGRFLGGGNGYPLQYSGLENSMDDSPWGCEESDTTE